MKWILLLFFWSFSLALFAGEKSVPTILAIGDSITQDGPSFVGYREVLVPALKEQGLRFEFIGPKKDKISAHAGFGGRNTAFLRGIFKETYSRYPADIVMIHSGHNSFAKDKPVPGIVKDTRAMIAMAHEINPEVVVLLAQVIPAGKLPKYAYIPELNRQLEVLANVLVKEGHRVILVNQEEGFDWRVDAVDDKVHPSASGGRKMAAKWMEALVPLLEK